MKISENPFHHFPPDKWWDVIKNDVVRIEENLFKLSFAGSKSPSTIVSEIFKNLEYDMWSEELETWTVDSFQWISELCS